MIVHNLEPVINAMPLIVLSAQTGKSSNQRFYMHLESNTCYEDCGILNEQDLYPALKNPYELNRYKIYYANHDLKVCLCKPINPRMWRTLPKLLRQLRLSILPSKQRWLSHPSIRRLPWLKMPHLFRRVRELHLV